MLLELCVADSSALSLLDKYPINRIELCQALEIGGLTPNEVLQRKALRSFKNVHVLIRCRMGDFFYTEVEKQLMLEEIASSVSLGVAGVVVGSLTADKEIDTAFIQEIRHRFPNLELTFHRAFDDIQNPLKAMDELIQLGVKRILTSGGQNTVLEGVKQIQACIAYAQNRIEIMIGGGISPENIAGILQLVQPDAVHFSGTESIYLSESSLFAAKCLKTSEHKVAGIISAMAQ